MSDMTIQIYNQNWYIVETHSIPDKKEVENLTDLNVDAYQAEGLMCSTIKARERHPRPHHEGATVFARG